MDIATLLKGEWALFIMENRQSAGRLAAAGYYTPTAAFRAGLFDESAVVAAQAFTGSKVVVFEGVAAATNRAIYRNMPFTATVETTSRH